MASTRKPVDISEGVMLDRFRKRAAQRPRIEDRYEILGFISSGTYGRVYKAKKKEIEPAALTEATDSEGEGESGSDGEINVKSEDGGANRSGPPPLVGFDIYRDVARITNLEGFHPYKRRRQEPAPVELDKVNVDELFNELNKDMDLEDGEKLDESDIRDKDLEEAIKAKTEELQKKPTYLYAIKKFKPDKEGDSHSYTGLSQSAVREMALCKELRHINIVRLEEIVLQDKSVYMVFEYVEHDFLQIIHHHTQLERGKPIPDFTIKSFVYQLLNGVAYMHDHWVMHRDLKPANILVTAQGIVKIGDLGLARTYHHNVHPLFNGDKVVVTIWYRAPELLLGARHYVPAIDIWAVGCIFAELLTLKPIFKGEEAKMDSKKNVPFQRSQMQKICEILGPPTREIWPTIDYLPEYHNMSSIQSFPNTLLQKCSTRSEKGFDLLSKMLTYDPVKRITATDALKHPYFEEEPEPSFYAFDGSVKYPTRNVRSEDNDMKGAPAAMSHPVGQAANSRKDKTDSRTPPRKRRPG